MNSNEQQGARQVDQTQKLLTPGAPPTESSASDGLVQAVIYLRVSTREQAERDIDAEGFSIPAQRQACIRKAEAMGAVVADEYVDIGESARSADRPQLQAMLKRLFDERDVSMVIVHKTDRLARSRKDDVDINLAIQAAGARLISCSENIDETPSGMLVHGIMASINEWYSRNLAMEASKGMSQKAQRGGTPGLAPIGYLNVLADYEGRRIRTVVVDPERASLVQWAFRAYASGEYTMRQLTAELEERGLRSRGTPRSPARPMTLSRVSKMLGNPYYLGIVIYKGVQYEGRHDSMIDSDVFDTVQAIKEGRFQAGEKQRINQHYLKGSLRCQCGSKMTFIRVTGRLGGKYDYFFCLGRQRRNGCTQPYVAVEKVERAIQRHWEGVDLDRDFGDRVRTLIAQEVSLRDQQETREAELQRRKLQKIQERQRKVLELYYDDAIERSVVADEQRKLRREHESASRRLERCERHYTGFDQRLTKLVDDLIGCGQAYAEADDHTRRTMNQTVFHHFVIDREDVREAPYRAAYGVLTDPKLKVRVENEFELIGKTKNPGALFERRGSSQLLLVREEGLEPSHPFGHRNLNPARLPIPPLARVTRFKG